MDILGKKFNRLKVVKRLKKNSRGEVIFLCTCECGNNIEVRKWNLTSGNTKSCGCLKSETSSNLGKSHTTHGMRYTKIYKIWESMKRRCDSKVCERYMNYGDRGIKYVDSWKEFVPFYEWAIKNGYKEGLSIDRIDVDGNYEPSNCQWVTLKKQHLNKTTSTKIEYNGAFYTVSELAEMSGVSYHTLYQRLFRLNWNIEDATKKLKTERGN